MNKRLKNGAIMVGYLEGEYGEHFVAADTQSGDLPFATWQMNVKTNETFWGNYFRTRGEAMEDLHKRAGIA